MSSTEFRTKIKHLRQKISKLPVVLDLIGGLAYLYAWLAGKTGKFDVSGIDEFEKLIADNDGGILARAGADAALFLAQSAADESAGIAAQ